MVQIMLADLSMSLDNVLAVAGAANGHTWVLLLGLLLSVVLMGVAANLLAHVLERQRWIAWVGLADRAVRRAEDDLARLARGRRRDRRLIDSRPAGQRSCGASGGRTCSRNSPAGPRGPAANCNAPATGSVCSTAGNARKSPTRSARVSSRPLFGFGREDFPLPRTAPLLADIAVELENGRGAVRLRGLDVARFTLDALRQAFWGIGCHLGTPLFQNANGEIMGEVRDESRLAVQTYETAEAGKVASSRSRTRGTGPLRWHTDRCDVIALLCARNARSGGVSKLASIVTIYNEIGRRRPDLLALLCQDYWRSRPSDEDGRTAQRAFALPVFCVLDGKLTCQYSRTYVEQAQEFPEVPRLTAAQNEALDLLSAVAEETCLHCPFEAGDIQLLNNHVVFHGRTAYEDAADGGQERLLLRLWLAVANSRRLPAAQDVLWGSVEPARCAAAWCNRGQGSARRRSIFDV